jgi:hypothetical protein
MFPRARCAHWLCNGWPGSELSTRLVAPVTQRPPKPLKRDPTPLHGDHSMLCFCDIKKETEIVMKPRPSLRSRFDPVPPLMMSVGVLLGAFWIMVM